MAQSIYDLTFEELQSYYSNVCDEREQLKLKRDEAMEAFQKTRGEQRFSDDEWKQLNESIRDCNRLINQLRKRINSLAQQERRSYYGSTRNGRYHGYQR